MYIYMYDQKNNCGASKGVDVLKEFFDIKKWQSIFMRLKKVAAWVRWSY